VIKATYCTPSTRFSCDISLQDTKNVQKSELIRQLLDEDQRARPMVFAVRVWAKHRGLHNGIDGLNSFALSILVLHFLQNYEYGRDAIDKDDTKIESILPLAAFFEFYGRSSLNNLESSLGLAKEDSMLPVGCTTMRIVDPVDRNDNPARNITPGSLRILRREMLRAFLLLFTRREFLRNICQVKKERGHC